MTDIIDIEEYKKRITEAVKNVSFDFSQEDREEVDKLTSAISEMYLKKLNDIDHSFSIRADPSQAKLVQQKIYAIRASYEDIIVDLIQELAGKSTELHLLRKYR